jgi:hypothetical protein
MATDNDDDASCCSIEPLFDDIKLEHPSVVVNRQNRQAAALLKLTSGRPTEGTRLQTTVNLLNAVQEITKFPPSVLNVLESFILPPRVSCCKDVDGCQKLLDDLTNDTKWNNWN